MMVREKLIENIKKAEDKVRQLYESEDNKRRLKLWQDPMITQDYFHALPAHNGTHFTVELERDIALRLFNVNFKDFYTDPFIHYLTCLKTSIFKFENFEDCTPILKYVPVYLSGAFEKSLFGGEDEETIYTEHDAVISKQALIKERSDLGKMKIPDFYKDGCMPRTIEFFEKIREIAADDFILRFPNWTRSAWGCAWQIRRLENLLYDYIEDPEWLSEFLWFLTDARKAWGAQRSKYLGEAAVTATQIYNDEVMVPVVSPTMYEDYILPTEIELSKYFGGTLYWHSCGNTTALFPLINAIPDLGSVTVSAWSDIEKAGIAYNQETAFEVQLNNYTDISKDGRNLSVKEKIELIHNSTPNRKVQIQAVVAQRDTDEQTVMDLKQICALGNEVLN